MHKIRMAYQPIKTIDDSNIIGYEALLRGDIPTSEILNNAKTTAEIISLDTTARRLALSDFEDLESSLFINCNPISYLYDDSLLNDLMGRKHKGNVVIEVTEQSIIDRTLFIQRTLEFRSKGICVALDDFGTGFSNLNIISLVDVDYIKIDKEITQNDVLSYRQTSVLKAIVDLCSSLECKVIAEGIETRFQLQALQKLDINLGQGYYLGKPQLEIGNMSTISL